MFTGIVEAVGRVAAVEPRGELVGLEVEAASLCDGVKVGDSVSVNGSCLTVTATREGRLAFEAVRETLEKTALGALREGSPVNLERALRADARLDGHIVQGHVDGTGRVHELRREGDDVRLFVDCPRSFAGDLVPKGSVAIDGVSLTVVDVAEERFEVALIPHTLASTTLGRLEPGRPVNLEGDVLAKYVRKYVERILPGFDGPTS